MENSFQTSFIPKKPAGENPVAPVSRVKKPVGILSFISILLLVLVLVATGAMYFYKNVLASEMSNLQRSLSLAKESFESEAIADLELFDERSSVAQNILANHKVFSPFFDLLNSLTIPTIQFVEFESQIDPDTDEISVSMKGIAKDYRSVALQAEVFNSREGAYLKDVIFSELALSDLKNTKGYVAFSVDLKIDPALLSYEKYVIENRSRPATSSQVTIPISNSEITIPDVTTTLDTSSPQAIISPLNSTSQ